MRNRTSRATDREDKSVCAHVSGSGGVELPLDVFGQARHAVRVFPWTWEAQTKLQLGRRIRSQCGRNGRICDLERLETDVTHWVGVGLGIFWSGGTGQVDTGENEKKCTRQRFIRCLGFTLTLRQHLEFLGQGRRG